LFADFDQKIFGFGEIDHCLIFKFTEIEQLIADIGSFFHVKAQTATRNHDAHLQSVMTERANTFLQMFSHRGSGCKVSKKGKRYSVFGFFRLRQKKGAKLPLFQNLI
jgi:hypothetical protein